MLMTGLVAAAAHNSAPHESPYATFDKPFDNVYPTDYQAKKDSKRGPIQDKVRVTPGPTQLRCIICHISDSWLKQKRDSKPKHVSVSTR